VTIWAPNFRASRGWIVPALRAANGMFQEIRFIAVAAFIREASDIEIKKQTKAQLDRDRSQLEQNNPGAQDSRRIRAISSC